MRCSWSELYYLKKLMDPEPEQKKTVMLLVNQQVVLAKRIQRRRPTRDRCWLRRAKVGSYISKDFPWEIVLKFLKDHPQSLILLQMVDRNLRQVLQNEHNLWVDIYKKHFHYKSSLVHKVNDPSFPFLSLFKEGLTGVPYHQGAVPGDQGPMSNAFRQTFVRYVRQWFALLHGTRCGMCGCRFRHEVYWALKARVCKLCVAQNSISDCELLETYGLAYSEILPEISTKVFYYQLTASCLEDRISMSNTRQLHIAEKSQRHMFWLPHISALFDLPALRIAQAERKKAGALLSALARKAWVVQKRVDLCSRSIDCLLIEAYRNEKRRLMQTRRQHTGGPQWAFSASGKVSRYQKRTVETDNVFFRSLYSFSDYCVNSL